MANSKDAAAILSLLEDLEHFNSLEEFVLSFARQVLVLLLEMLDNALVARKPEGYRIAGFRRRTLATGIGDIVFKRRLYVKATAKKSRGQGLFMLDEALRLRKGKLLSGRLLKLAISLATRLPFRQVAEVMQEAGLGNISHMTVHTEVRRAGLKEQASREALREKVFASGEEPKGAKKKVRILFIEVDGLVVPLQRSKQDRMEIKAGVIYEGWIEKGKRRQLKDPRFIMGIFPDAEKFWEALYVEITKHYELDEETILVVNGDGASWIQEEVKDYLPNVIVQVDRYHLYRDLRMALGEKAAHDLIKVLERGDDKTFLDTLQSLALEKVDHKQKIRRLQVYGYCRRHRENLLDYRLRLARSPEEVPLYGLGVAETTVDKKLATRMKKRGMSWTPEGVMAMSSLLMLKANGELSKWLEERTPAEEKNPVKVLKEMKVSRDEIGEYILATIPALKRPIRGEIWIKYILREIVNPRWETA